jgi:hypothetical protein
MKNKKELEKSEFITERETQKQPQVTKIRRDDKVRICGFKEGYKRSKA